METLTFVTGNIHKGYELQKRFASEQIPLEIIQMDFAEPEVNDIKVVSQSKAIQAYEVLQRPCFVIDSGFNILGFPGNPGYPGAMVRRSGLSEDIDRLLDIMKGVQDRSCEFLDCLTYYDGTNFSFFYGIDKGTLAYEKLGTPNMVMRSKLWYVFKPNGYDKTLAQMTDEERKNRQDGHVSAKDQFISWYKTNYLDAQHLQRIPSTKK